MVNILATRKNSLPIFGGLNYHNKQKNDMKTPLNTLLTWTYEDHDYAQDFECAITGVMEYEKLISKGIKAELTVYGDANWNYVAKNNYYVNAIAKEGSTAKDSTFGCTGHLKDILNKY